MGELTNAAAENWFWSIGGCIAITAILTNWTHGIITRLSRERTRREIAAYIAEGSMTPEQGERLMNAGEKGEE